MSSGAVVEIAGIPVRLRTEDHELRQALLARYANYLTDTPLGDAFEVTLRQVSGRFPGPEKARISCSQGVWRVRRCDSRAEWSPDAGSGQVWHANGSANSLEFFLRSLDLFLRILYSVLFARQAASCSMRPARSAMARLSFLRELPARARQQ